MLNKYRQYLIRGIAALSLMAISWCVGVNRAESYAPVDDLINSVNELFQLREITDVTVMANLVVSLQTIGTLIDGNNKNTAKELLTSFSQEVTSLSGILMTTNAATRLVHSATEIASTL